MIENFPELMTDIKTQIWEGQGTQTRMNFKKKPLRNRQKNKQTTINITQVYRIQTAENQGQKGNLERIILKEDREGEPHYLQSKK